jgi:hypothetical protein
MKNSKDWEPIVQVVWPIKMLKVLNIGNVEYKMQGTKQAVSETSKQQVLHVKEGSVTLGWMDKRTILFRSGVRVVS